MRREDEQQWRCVGVATGYMDIHVWAFWWCAWWNQHPAALYSWPHYCTVIIGSTVCLITASLLCSSCQQFTTCTTLHILGQRRLFNTGSYPRRICHNVKLTGRTNAINSLGYKVHSDLFYTSCSIFTIFMAYGLSKLQLLQPLFHKQTPARCLIRP